MNILQKQTEFSNSELVTESTQKFFWVIFSLLGKRRHNTPMMSGYGYKGAASEFLKKRIVYRFYNGNIMLDTGHL